MTDDVDFDAGFGNVLGTGRRGRRLPVRTGHRARPRLVAARLAARPDAVTAPNAEYRVLEEAAAARSGRRYVRTEVILGAADHAS
jgi:hypothetical protein